MISLDLSIAGKAHFFMGNNVDPLVGVFAADLSAGVVDVASARNSCS